MNANANVIKIVHASATGYRRSRCGRDVDLDVEDMVTLQPEKVTCSGCNEKMAADSARMEIKRFNQRVLDDGAEAVDGLGGFKHYTVIGVYVSGDADCIGEKFADYVDAESWDEAEKMVKAKRGGDVLIAGVLVGQYFCVDEQ